MTAPALPVPRQHSPVCVPESSQEDEFHALVESIGTLLFSTPRGSTSPDTTVLAEALHELERRWPDAAAQLGPRVESCGW